MFFSTPGIPRASTLFSVYVTAETRLLEIGRLDAQWLSVASSSDVGSDRHKTCGEAQNPIRASIYTRKVQDHKARARSLGRAAQGTV
jgi:hypothetical protein